MNKLVSNSEKKYLAVELSADTKFDVLRQMAASLYEEGYVKETYSEAIINREKKFPTGLPTGKINVAIPHTDPEYVNHAAICLGILDKPVTFEVMGMEGEEVDVSVLFMLSIKHKEDQMDTLAELIGVCQNQDVLEKIASKNIEAISQIMDSLKI
ncbi:MAG: PTS sugar transporter subunit IIA [Eubacteriales bacterium]|nr:PTS sugar transporter subunit IIA [Eubacteriales bacterium]